MPKYQITGPDGKAFEVTAPDGASESDVLAYAQRNFKLAAAPAKTKPFGEDLNDTIAGLPRQLGLTARAGLRAVDGTVNMLTAPIRAGLNAVLPKQGGLAGQISGQGQRDAIGPLDTVGMAEKIGLPRPRPGTESWVNDAATMGFSAAAPMAGGAAVAKTATNATAQGVGRMLAANPVQQFASAGAAGAAGGYTRETGGNEGAQLAASLAAGVLTPMAMNGAMRAGRAVQNLRSPPPADPMQIDITINNAIERSGMSLDQLPSDVARGIRADVGKAMQIGGNLSEDAVRRLADYRLTGATPTHGSLVRTPAAFTQQKNLAKLGVNSKDPAAQALANVEFDNNSTMIKSLNGVGASTADDAMAGGQKIMGGVQAYDNRANTIIGKLYDKARASDGRSAALDPHAFTNKAGQLLNDANVESFLTPDIRNKLNQFAAGDVPLNVDIAEQFKTSIGNIQRGSADGNVRKALGLVRQALDDTPLQPGQELGGAAQMAFQRARNMNRQYMGVVEKTPALQAVRDGIEPDKFVQQFIIGNGGKSNVMDVAMLKNSVKGSPQAMDAIKEQIALHLKEKALTGKSDEVGRISESALNKAIKGIGERKLALFFSKAEIDQIKATGRVASYEQVQPVGSAVGNSNTAAAGGAMLLDRIGSSPLLSKIPMGRLLAEPAQNISIGMRAGRTMDAPRALTDGIRQPLLSQPRGLMLSPAALIGMEDEETRRKRAAGLLLP